MRWRRRPPVVVAPPQPPVPQRIEHILNDLSTPDLVKEIVVLPPQPDNNRFVVKGFTGSSGQKGSVEYHAAQAYVSIAEILNFYNGVTESIIPRWPRCSVLAVLPRAGENLNAFYDGRSLQFFYIHHRHAGSLFTIDSADIAVHECAHGILDCIRPELFSAASLEIAAFHESFGDISSIFHSLLHDELLQRAQDETGGDLRKPSVITRMAEDFGRIIHVLDPNGRSPEYLRCAINDFKYVDPATLPHESTSDKLCAECHNFSRIFTAAFWDIYVMIYEDNKANGHSPLDAMRLARDLMGRYLMKAVQNAPANAKFYESMAKTLLWADVTLSNRRYHDRMQQIFQDRNMVGLQLRMLSAPKCEKDSEIVKIQSRVMLKMADVLVQSQSLDSNPLYDVEVEIPIEKAYLYDKEKNVMDVITASDDDGVRAAHAMIEHLHRAERVGPDERTPWEIRDGKLTRTRTCCH
jgi:hypothetical protein